MQLEGLYRLIQPTHRENGSSSSIDVIFTSYTNLVTDFGVDPKLYTSSCSSFCKNQFQYSFTPDILSRHLGL